MDYLLLSLRRTAAASGVDHFGVADLAAVSGELDRSEFSVGVSYPLAVSIGVSLDDTIIDQLPSHRHRPVALAYRHHWATVNARLNESAETLSTLILQAGFSAQPVSASEIVDRRTLRSTFSHKIAARLAGLGWIGKSCLLITPESGPRVRWATILTDAPLEPSGELMEDRCGSCTLCVEICPCRAFTGRAFDDGESRDLRYDAHSCRVYHESLRRNSLRPLCGLCVYVCPYGRKGKMNA